MKKLITCTVLVMVSYMATAQTDRVVGLTATVQSEQLGVQIPIWIGNKFLIAPSLGIAAAEGAGSDISLALAPRLYLKKDALSPYISARVGTFLYFPPPLEGSSLSVTNDMLTGLAFGGEYFFSNHFSVGVEAQANVTFSDEESDRFGNSGGTHFNLGTLLFTTVYF